MGRNVLLRQYIYSYSNAISVEIHSNWDWSVNEVERRSGSTGWVTGRDWRVTSVASRLCSGLRQAQRRTVARNAKATAGRRDRKNRGGVRAPVFVCPFRHG
jgi:hypothetical protein